MSGKIGRSMRYRNLWFGTSLCKKGVMNSYEEIFYGKMKYIKRRIEMYILDISKKFQNYVKT